MRGFVIAALAAALLGAVGCQEEGPAEEMGERMDEALEDAGLREEGAFERAGERLDEAAEEAEEEFED